MGVAELQEGSGADPSETFFAAGDGRDQAGGGGGSAAGAGGSDEGSSGAPAGDEAAAGRTRIDGILEAARAGDGGGGATSAGGSSGGLSALPAGVSAAAAAAAASEGGGAAALVRLRVDDVDSENPLRPRYTGACLGWLGHACTPIWLC